MVDYVIGLFLSEESRRKTLGGSTSRISLNAQRRGRTIERGNNSKNHGKSRGKSKVKRSQYRGLRDFWYYGKLGHKKKYCQNQKNNEVDKLEGNNNENVVSNKSEEDTLLLSLESVDNLWGLDSGASFHATPHRGYFNDYVQRNFGLIYL